MDEKTKTKETGKETAPAAAPDPWHSLTTLRDEVDRLFDDFASHWSRGRGPLSQLRALPSAWFSAEPAIDVVDLEKSIEIRAELPGLDEKDVEIEVTGGMLRIHGEKKEETETGEKGGRYYMSERRYGAFERSVRLPDGLDLDKPDARFAKGVLTVSFPKTGEAMAKTKKISIRSE